MSRRRFVWPIALGCLLAATHTARAATLIYGYDSAVDHLVSFFSSTPGTLFDDVALTGLTASETIVGLDFRPLDHRLYAVAVDGAMSRLVTIDTATGAVASVGQLLATPFGSFFGLDVNPVADRIRFIGDADVSQRLDPDTGALAATDSALAYGPGDVAVGQNPSVVHVAYTNSFAGAVATTLYGIDTVLDTLVIVAPPNAGTLATVGSLGVDTNAIGGFDIEPDANTAFAALRVGGVSSLYVVNLTTGAAALVGSIGGGGAIAGIAVPEPGAVASALCAVAVLGAVRSRTQRTRKYIIPYTCTRL